jgi:hypothetical protein
VQSAARKHPVCAGEEATMGWFGGSDGDTVLAKGSRHHGRITAIRVTQTRDEHPIRLDTYVVAVEPAGGGAVHAIRQRLLPDDYVRLGMIVVVAVHRGAAIIDWAATMAASGIAAENNTIKWKMAKDDGAGGIIDENLGLAKWQRKGLPATVEITGFGVKQVLGGLATKPQLTVIVRRAGDAAYETTMSFDEAPHYARHLPVVGASLPGYVDAKRPDKVTIDWPAAAMRDPGVGVGPSPDMAANASTNVFTSGRVEQAFTALGDRFAAQAGMGNPPPTADEAGPQQ